MIIIWDDLKREANLGKHGFDFADLDLEFFATALITPAKGGRSRAIGQFRNRQMIAVIFRLLGAEAISVVSMRPASRKERRYP